MRKVEKKYLTISPISTGTLLIFDFEKKELAFKVKFLTEGTHDYESAFLLSMDSIIVLGAERDRFYLSDTSGRIKNKYILFPKKIADDDLLLGSGITNCFKVNFTGFYVFNVQPGLLERGEEVFKKPCVIHYNFKKEDWEYINVSFPALYYQSGGHYTVTHLWGDLEVVDNKLVVNFPASNYLTVYENGNIKQEEAKADELSIIVPPSKNLRNDLDDIDTYVLQSPAYQFLLYDSYRKVYYRFLLGGQEDMSSKGDILKNYDEKPCTVVILDSAFSKIGEFKLPPRTYHIPDHFVGPKGLYLSTNYVDRSAISKNMFSYRLLSLRITKQKVRKLKNKKRQSAGKRKWEG